ncbi:MAG: hypothetical protein BWY06_02525 [Candidatus Latescibacteria bacterium ADurb.Bin168]|nr:MAG: hypothetical protein BWY06_02525 [Candidatus Latescibacteria bacterium ADurb.Bin168]
MFFRRNRVVHVGYVSGLEIDHVHLKADGRARIYPYLPSHNQRGLLFEGRRGFEDLRRNVPFEHHALHDAGTVTHLKEMQFARRPHIVQPPLKDDLLSFVPGNVFDGWPLIPHRSAPRHQI